MNTLEQFRREIDMLDANIIETLGHRFEVCRKIARLKKQEFIPMMQHGRVEEVHRRCAELGRQHGVSADLVHAIYRLIIDETCEMENGIIGAPAVDQKMQPVG